MSTNFKAESQEISTVPAITLVESMPRPRVKGFILEVLMQVECAKPNGSHCECSHIGYMQKVFKQKSDAANYYDSHNKHMRPLNAHGTYQSDWDANTRLMCIVREHHKDSKPAPPAPWAPEASCTQGRQCGHSGPSFIRLGPQSGPLALANYYDEARVLRWPLSLTSFCTSDFFNKKIAPEAPVGDSLMQRAKKAFKSNYFL